MDFNYSEAFKKLDLLNEDVFDTSLSGINKLSNFLDSDMEDDTITVIDTDLSHNSDEVKKPTSYIGNLILSCNVCHSYIFSKKEDTEIDEEGIVNCDDACPYCGEKEGFVILGQIEPFTNSTEDSQTAAVSVKSDPPIEDKIDAETDAPVTDDQLDTSDSELKVSEDDKVDSDASDGTLEDAEDPDTEVKTNTPSIMITEVSDDTKDDIVDANSDVDPEPEVDTADTSDSKIDTADESKIQDDDIDNIDDIDAVDDADKDDNKDEDQDDDVDVDAEGIEESYFDRLCENYIKEVYDNIESYKTTSASCNDHMMIIEGTIKFNSGKEKHTGFIFEAANTSNSGTYLFEGKNNHFSNSDKAYMLSCSLKDKQFLPESFMYNYTVEGIDHPIHGETRIDKQ